MVTGEDYLRWQTLPGMFFELAEGYGTRPLFWAKRDGTWQSHSWQTTAEQVSALARALRGAGVKPGDRVMLVGENRPEWGIADLAIMAARAVTVPAYITNTVEDHQHIVSDSGAVLAIVSTKQLASRLLPALAGTAVTRVIAMEAPDAPAPAGVEVVGWEDALADGAARTDDTMGELGQIKRADASCIIYTSGTGGAPKGVILSHGAILANCYGAWHLLADDFGMTDEIFLSFLPLSHSYEHTTGLLFALSTGAEIYYAESAEKLIDNIGEVRPTLMTAVPRLYETVYRRITQGVARQGGLKATLFHRALELGKKRYHQRGLNPVDGAQDWVLDKLVRDKVRERFGGRLKAWVSGGAPLNVEIGLFFTALGIPILQGYGQTESAPVVSCNPPSRPKIHTVGPPVRGVEVKIAEDGEILVRGELVMDGYWGLAELSAETVKDGWLHTGDIGKLDEDGYIQITDRKKDIIVFSGGDNVSPARIEGMLALEPAIAQAFVYGDRRPHLVGVLVPDEEFRRDYAKTAGVKNDLATLREDAGFHAALDEAVTRVNGHLANMERVRRFIVANDAWTIENGYLTPSMKVKRHLVRDLYQAELDGLY